MKLEVGTLACVCAFAWLSGPARADGLPEDTDDPREIMEAVEARNLGDQMTARITMTIISSSGDKRKRVMLVRRMKTEDSMPMLLQFDSPADMRNTGLLSVDHDDGDKDDDQWLYLPSTRKTIRTSGGDKSGAFVGSDFSYHDMTRHHASQWSYELLKSAKVGDEVCWVIEAKPKTKKAKEESGYVKVHFWVSKEKLMPVQLKAWISAGKKLKYMKLTEITKIDGIWVPHKIAARTVRNGKAESTTVMAWDKVKFGVESVKESDFTERRLEKGL